MFCVGLVDCGRSEYNGVARLGRMVLVARTAKDSRAILQAWAVDCGNEKTAIKFVQMLDWLVDDVAARRLLVPDNVKSGTRTWMWFDSRVAPLEDIGNALSPVGVIVSQDELATLLIRMAIQKDVPGEISRDSP